MGEHKPPMYSQIVKTFLSCACLSSPSLAVPPRPLPRRAERPLRHTALLTPQRRYLIVTSLLARVPIQWPPSIARLFRLQSTAGNNVEVFSVDCSAPYRGHSRVYDRALGWLVAFFVISLFPAVPLYFHSLCWRVRVRQEQAADRFRAWAGAAVRRAAEELLHKLPGEDAASFPAVKARGGGGGMAPCLPFRHVPFVAGAMSPKRNPTPNAQVTPLEGPAGGARALAAASASRPHFLGRGLDGGAAHLLESALRARVALARPTRSSAPHAAHGGQLRHHHPHPAEEAGPPPRLLRLTPEDRALERRMLARCGGKLAPRPDDPENEADVRRVALDCFVVTALCASFFMWTPASAAALQLWSCVRVERQPELNPLPSEHAGLWLLADVSQRCFRGPHLRWVLAVGIPGLALVAAGVPLLVVAAVRAYRDHIAEDRVVARFGFLYYGARRGWKCYSLS